MTEQPLNRVMGKKTGSKTILVEHEVRQARMNEANMQWWWDWVAGREIENAVAFPRVV